MEDKDIGPKWPKTNECNRCHKIKELKDFYEIMYIGKKEGEDFWSGVCIECKNQLKGKE